MCPSIPRIPLRDSLNAGGQNPVAHFAWPTGLRSFFGGLKSVTGHAAQCRYNFSGEEWHRAKGGPAAQWPHIFSLEKDQHVLKSVSTGNHVLCSSPKFSCGWARCKNWGFTCQTGAGARQMLKQQWTCATELSFRPKKLLSEPRNCLIHRRTAMTGTVLDWSYLDFLALNLSSRSTGLNVCMAQPPYGRDTSQPHRAFTGSSASLF